MQELIKEFKRENLKGIVFVVVALLLLAVSAYPQRNFGGTVVEVVDGKTAIVQVPTGTRVKVILQFIEIPEAEQPLHTVVKEHLQKLVLGKTVEFMPRRVLKDSFAGRLFLGDVDVSQQMLRDGAAWYALPEKSAQDAAECEAYLQTEALAKQEKRGVWGVENLKTAWEFRAEREESKRRAEQAKLEAMTPKQEQKISENKPVVKASKQKAPTVVGIEVDLWSAVSNAAELSDASDDGLISGTVRDSGLRYVMTAGDKGWFTNTSFGGVMVETRSIYIASDGKVLKSGSGYAIGFLATNKIRYLFAEQNDLRIEADDKKFNLGKAYRLAQLTPYGAQEMMLYKIDRKILEKIASAKRVDVYMGSFDGRIDGWNLRLQVKNLLAMTAN